MLNDAILIRFILGGSLAVDMPFECRRMPSDALFIIIRIRVRIVARRSARWRDEGEAVGVEPNMLNVFLQLLVGSELLQDIDRGIRDHKTLLPKEAFAKVGYGSLLKSLAAQAPIENMLIIQVGEDLLYELVGQIENAHGIYFSVSPLYIRSRCVYLYTPVMSSIGKSKIAMSLRLPHAGECRSYCPLPYSCRPKYRRWICLMDRVTGTRT
jgi:hypothetical protein